MGVGSRMWVGCQQVKRIIEDEEEGNDERLRDFDAVNPSEDIDAVWAEYGHGCHVDVVEESQLEKFAEVGLEGSRDHDLGYAEIDEVDD